MTEIAKLKASNIALTYPLKLHIAKISKDAKELHYLAYKTTSGQHEVWDMILNNPHTDNNTVRYAMYNKKEFGGLKINEHYPDDIKEYLKDYEIAIHTSDINQIDKLIDKYLYAENLKRTYGEKITNNYLIKYKCDNFLLGIIVSNKYITLEFLNKIVDELNDFSWVGWDISKNPKCNFQLLSKLHKKTGGFESEIASCKDTPEEVLRELYDCKRYEDDKWLKYYIKERLASNPNTPIDVLEKLSELNVEEINSHLALNPNTPLNVIYKWIFEDDLSESILCEITCDEFNGTQKYNSKIPNEIRDYMEDFALAIGKEYEDFAEKYINFDDCNDSDEFNDKFKLIPPILLKKYYDNYDCLNEEVKKYKGNIKILNNLFKNDYSDKETKKIIRNILKSLND